MRSRLIIVALVVLGTIYACKASADNFESFKSSSRYAGMIDAHVKSGPTDSDCAEIELLFRILSSERKNLTAAQQTVLWDRFPYFAGIACNWKVGHEWIGNDCQYQCGTLEECQAEVEK